MTFYSIYFGSARVLLPHAELHHLSTSINGRRRYRLDQSTPSLAAIVHFNCAAAVLHNASGLANYPIPRTNPRTLASHYTLLAPCILPSPENNKYTISYGTKEPQIC